MSSKKLAKPDLTHSQKNASSDDPGSINSHLFSLGSDGTRSILSHSQIHGSDETKSIDSRSFGYDSDKTISIDSRSARYGSDETQSMDSRSVRYGSDETKSIDSRSVRYGSDETQSIDSRSIRYGSDETQSIDSRSVRYGSDETKSIDSRSIRYGSDKAKMKNALEKSERRKKGTIALSSVFEMCDIHEGKLLDFYCANHNVSGCSLCMKLTHGSCKDVQPRSAQDVTRAAKQLETIVINEDNNKNKDTDSKTNADGEVGGKSADIATRVDDEVGEKSADIANRGDDEVGGKSADIATRGGDEVGGKSTNIVTRGSNEVGGKSADIATRGGDEVGGKSVDIATESGDAVGGQLQSQSNNSDVAGDRSKPRHLYPETGSRDINVQIEGDRWPCSIWDICQLPDGRLLMADMRNDRLKLLDQSYNIIDHCDMPRPSSVCWCDKRAYVGQYGRTLQFVSIQKKMKIFRRMELDHDCIGLAYRDGELYVADGHANIHVYNKAWNKLRVYTTGTLVGKDASDEYLTVSIDGRQLYMTHGVYLICMGRQSGKIIWSVKGDNDSSYFRVCVDKDNNLMVCDEERGEIVQYSGDGEKMGVIVGGLKCPRSIFLYHDSKTLLIGKLSFDKIKMFNLK